MNNFLFALWFFLPAGIANVTPIFAGHVPFLKHLNYPLDLYKKLNGKRIFGDHKTIRGLISGIILGTLTSSILFQISYHLPSAIYYLPHWYFTTNPMLLGFLLSSGALFGDMIKSFFKRQINIKPGSSWIPFDQIDYIIGGLFFSSFLHMLTLYEYITILILWVVIHILSTYSGFFLHLKKQPL